MSIQVHIQIQIMATQLKIKQSPLPLQVFNVK